MMITCNKSAVGWKIALVCAAAVWGGSFVVIKDSLSLVTPAWLMTLRFALATPIVAAVFWRRLRAYLSYEAFVAGVLLGVINGMAFVLQNRGLADITPGRNAFLTALYCVLTPFVGWGISRVRPGLNNYVASVMAVAGVGMIALGESLSPALSLGDGLTIAAAGLYALHIALVAKLAARHDVMVLTIVQLLISAVVAGVAALVTEPLPDFSVVCTGPAIFSLGYQVLLATSVCMVIQNSAQAHVPPAQAALILSLESVFAVAASVVFYGEEITLRIAAGFALIFVAVVVSELGGRWLRRRAQEPEALLPELLDLPETPLTV